MNNDERSGCQAGSHRTLTRAAGGWTLAIWQARWHRLQPNATRFSNIGNSCGSCGADLQVCAGPPGPALRATEPAISAREEVPSPAGFLGAVMAPRRVALAGVSSRGEGFGRTILENLRRCPSLAGRIVVVKPGQDSLEGVPCVPGVAALKEAPVDLLIL